MLCTVKGTKNMKKNKIPAYRCVETKISNAKKQNRNT